MSSNLVNVSGSHWYEGYFTRKHTRDEAESNPDDFSVSSKNNKRYKDDPGSLVAGQEICSKKCEDHEEDDGVFKKNLLNPVVTESKEAKPYNFPFKYLTAGTIESSACTTPPPNGFKYSTTIKKSEKLIKNLSKEFGREIENLEKMFHDSVLHESRWNNFSKAKELLDRGVSIESLNKRGRTPLHAAVVNKNARAVSFLLKHGANIDAESKEKLWTPLHLAVFTSHQNIISLLIAGGANMNSRNNDLWTPLHMVAEYGNHQMLSYFLKEVTKHHGDYQQLDFNAMNDKLETPLHLAGSRSDHRMVKILLKCGANVNAANHCGQTPLHYLLQDAIVESDVDITLKLLLEWGANMESEDLNLETPLHYVAIRGNVQSFKTLVLKGANVFAENIDRQTMLHLSVESGCMPMVEYVLLQLDIDINSRNVDMETPLHYSSWNGNLPISKTLINHGANVNLENIDGRTPLHMVAENGDDDLALLLLDHGASPEAVDNNSERPLDVASSNGNISISTMILDIL